jgi:hypothetical protein
MLIRAHLSTSTVSLHVRRTLDQSFYHNIDTEIRDQDQVVYRYQTKGKPLDECDPKIVMVYQLWMWILGANLILTAFPQRWQQPRNDPLNVLDSIIEDINSKTRDRVTSVYDLAMIITNRCSGVFDRHRMGDEEYQFLDLFVLSIILVIPDFAPQASDLCAPAFVVHLHVVQQGTRERARTSCRLPRVQHSCDP